MSIQRKIVGLHAVQSTLEHAPERVLCAWVDVQRMDAKLNQIKQVLETLGVKVKTSSKKELDSLSEGRNHQGIIIEAMQAKELNESDLHSVLDKGLDKAFFLVLDHVQDPHNLGACLRSADAFGVDGLIITKDQSVGITPTVAKVASGAAETVPLYKVTNLSRTLDCLKASGIWIVGAAGDASQTVCQIDLDMPLALVIGAEGKGLRRLTKEQCDFLVKIPMVGQVESLNLSVATGILLFEALRQRGRMNKSPMDS